MESAPRQLALRDAFAIRAALPEVFVDQPADLTYDIGTEDLTAATIEVTADTFPLVDSVSGMTRSLTGILRYAFTQPGERTLVITTRDASGQAIKSSVRMLLVR